MEACYTTEARQVNAFLLDTHYWLWFQSANTDELSATDRRHLDALQMTKRLHISAISILELARLVSAGKLDLGMTIERFIEEATAEGNLTLLPLSPQILIESTRLPGDIHRDPSDRLLIATAREHGLTLITRDKDILKYAARGHLNARKP